MNKQNPRSTWNGYSLTYIGYYHFAQVNENINITIKRSKRHVSLVRLKELNCMSLSDRKHTFGNMHLTKIQISVHLRSLIRILTAFRIAEDAKFLFKENEDSGQTARARRLIWVFLGCTHQKVRFLTLRSVCFLFHEITDIDECLYDVCSTHARCENVPGSYICTCKEEEHYTGNGTHCRRKFLLRLARLTGKSINWSINSTKMIIITDLLIIDHLISVSIT